ncbi:molybdopterin-dependent oxidoreductase [Reinekea marinisedimentorum]|uniref:Trimethylamine-N-oxide reductase (Cytochrome c) n=1 Tax=Reinekea marinisedimentorum TaxID=230495 RepID=A0A4R3IB86_9GAMM|nr:molybdopterin-dependent oxidoreductase [Reinekea marinisedimentorum]TCS42710.1 trimethylamine-N-oxide reductase (cytochrome c) [Reinekea marinisedimentorum]
MDLSSFAPEQQCRATLLGLVQAIKVTSKTDKKFRELVAKKDFTICICIRTENIGRVYTFKGGKVTSKSGKDYTTDVVMEFNDSRDAMRMFVPWRDYLDVINMAKLFKMGASGNETLAVHFTDILSAIFDNRVKYGIKMPDGTMRYTNNTNGGPVFVYVKDGKIIRITPMDLAEDDAEPWTIKARGKEFTPTKKVTVSPHTQGIKSTIYSKDRILYPMKRVDFDPNGERNPQNRGISGYERISWDEATDIVANEIMRVKEEHGPGAIMNGTGSHHTWGNLGYWLSCRIRFFNTIGTTYVAHNPDSWEGFYWGAMHHWGNSIRLGSPDTYNTVEDALQHTDMIVFWSADPESTSGVYGAMEGTQRRLWAKELGIEFVHIDPFYNHTAALLGGKWLANNPGTSNAMALAIAYVWMQEGLYDKDFVEDKTEGFAEWKEYVLGNEDGIPKTPEWQEPETGIPAHDVRALARKWGSKKVYLAAGGIQGFGSAGRAATGSEWARSMVCLMAMQGIGKPGVNMGCLQQGTPIDTRFFFPGYAEGGLSGDYTGTGVGINMYQRMPQVMTMNPVKQKVPRLRIPEAIMDGHTTGYPTDTTQIEGQFFEFGYPAPGHSPIKMYYKYGGSHFGTMNDTNRYARMYRHKNLETVINQSIWMEGEAKFADVILPACTNFERWDIGEFASSGGYIHHNYNQCNHRVITLQHKCIEPLGESKSDFEIFKMIATKMDMGAYFTEGSSELEWTKRLFYGTDLKDVTTWSKFLKKGYYIVPPPKEEDRDPVSWRWYYEGRKKDVPEMNPLPADTTKFFEGLQTQSGKIEFVCNSLKRFAPDDPERPVMTKYIPSWEGTHSGELYEKYPLQLITPHSRYSFHTMMDGKDSHINDIVDHRVEIDGYYYWIVRLNDKDAEARGITQNQIVEVHNDRGSVLCAAQLTSRVPKGTVHSYESSALYEPIGEPGESPDRGGSMNVLTPSRPIIKKSHSTACNSCLVNIRVWEGE